MCFSDLCINEQLKSQFRVHVFNFDEERFRVADIYFPLKGRDQIKEFVFFTRRCCLIKSNY